MIKISIEIIKNRFDELIDILKNTQENDKFLSIKYGALCVSVHTYKEQLILDSKDSKEKFIKNQRAINLLGKVEDRMSAKINSSFNEIKESVYLGYETFNQLNIIS